MPEEPLPEEPPNNEPFSEERSSEKRSRCEEGREAAHLQARGHTASALRMC